jgi:hypothetical protein
MINLPTAAAWTVHTPIGRGRIFTVPSQQLPHVAAQPWSAVTADWRITEGLDVSMPRRRATFLQAKKLAKEDDEDEDYDEEVEWEEEDDDENDVKNLDEDEDDGKYIDDDEILIVEEADLDEDVMEDENSFEMFDEGGGADGESDGVNERSQS